MDTFAIVTLVLLALAMVWRSTVGFALIVVIQQVFREIGLVILAEEGLASYETAWMFLGSIVCLLGGYLATELVLRSRIRRRGRTVLSEPRLLRALPDRAVWAVVIVAGVLGIYHLVVGGLPIFSSNIETERFDFTSSGLFGIPGRMYLFGINIAWVVASANAQALGRQWRSYGAWRWATGFLVASTILSGFKGEVFSLILTVIALYTIISDTRVTLGTVVRRYWWAGVLALGYFVVIAALYPSYANSGLSIWEQLFNRLTVVPSQAVYYAMEGRAYFPQGVPILSDFSYFLHKYSGQEIFRSYSFERAVSASIIGVDPSSSAWTTPVTLSGFAEVYASFGQWVGFAAMAASGVILSYGESAPRRSVYGLILRAITGLFMFNWLVKGGFAYYLLNLVAVTAILAIAAFTVTLLIRSAPPRSRRVPGRGLTQPAPPPPALVDRSAERRSR